jgi:tetratricopeptide (TPR) repeat protein
MKEIFSAGRFLWLGLFFLCSFFVVRQTESKEKRDVHSSPLAGEMSAKTAKKVTDQAQKNTFAAAEYHFSMAQAYSADGETDKAIEEYKLTLMFDSNSPLVYARLATEYVKKGMLSIAMETCKEALQRDPKFIDARMMLAGLYSTSHETQAALSEYDRILKIDPKHEEAVIYKSQVLTEDGHLQQAATVLQKFIQNNSDSALALYYLGRAEQQQDHFKEAVIAYRKAMAAKPGFVQAALALGYLYEEKHMNQQAIQVYRSLYDSSQDVSAANRIATIYLKEEKYQQAIPFLQAIEAADPDDMNVRVKLGLVQMELKQHAQAIAIFKNILEKNPDSDRLHYYLGSLYEETKQMDLAMDELRLIKPESKLYSDAVLHVAYLLKQFNRVSEAKSYLKGAIEKAPKTPGFYIFQASLEEETKAIPVAVKILQKALSEFPEDEKIRYYLGSLFDRQGEVDKGLEQMEAILKLNPENVDALNYIGYTWTQKGIRLNDAEKLLRRALGLRPDNGYIQDSWGWYLFTRGRLHEAVVELEKAARMKPNEPTILEHLGDAYLRSNLREKALMRYSDAVQYAEDEDSKRKIQGKAESLRQELAKGRSMLIGDQGRIPASSQRSP